VTLTIFRGRRKMDVKVKLSDATSEQGQAVQQTHL
jgi:hypothetical protein